MGRHTRVNIRAAFQRWRELKECEGLESDAEVALFFLDRLILVRFIFACFRDRCYARVVFVRVGQRYQNRGEVLA